MHDTISRQDAIDALMNDSDWADAIPTIASLPSTNAVEVVRCKDCKHWNREIHNGIEYFNFSSCDLNHYGDGHNFYCADAERRTDG